MPNELVRRLERKNPDGKGCIYTYVRTDDLSDSSKIPPEALYPGLVPLVETVNKQSVLWGQELAKNAKEAKGRPSRILDKSKCSKKLASQHDIGEYEDPSINKLDAKHCSVLKGQKTANMHETRGDAFEMQQ